AAPMPLAATPPMNSRRSVSESVSWSGGMWLLRWNGRPGEQPRIVFGRVEVDLAVRERDGGDGIGPAGEQLPGARGRVERAERGEALAAEESRYAERPGVARRGHRQPCGSRRLDQSPDVFRTDERLVAQQEHERRDDRVRLDHFHRGPHRRAGTAFPLAVHDYLDREAAQFRAKLIGAGAEDDDHRPAIRRE